MRSLTSRSTNRAVNNLQIQARSFAVRTISSFSVEIIKTLLSICLYIINTFYEIGINVIKTLCKNIISFVAENTLGYVTAFCEVLINSLCQRATWVKEVIESGIAVVTKSYTSAVQEIIAAFKEIPSSFLHIGSISVEIQLEPGDILYRRLEGAKGIFYHYGVYIGKNEVIQFTCSKCDGSEGILEKVSFDEFLDGRTARWVQTKFKHATKNKKNICKKAFEIYQLDEEKEDWCEYNWRKNNCEHFANYCATGQKYSSQVNWINCIWQCLISMYVQ